MQIDTRRRFPLGHVHPGGGSAPVGHFVLEGSLQGGPGGPFSQMLYHYPGSLEIWPPHMVGSGADATPRQLLAAGRLWMRTARLRTLPRLHFLESIGDAELRDWRLKTAGLSWICYPPAAAGGLPLLSILISVHRCVCQFRDYFKRLCFPVPLDPRPANN